MSEVLSSECANSQTQLLSIIVPCYNEEEVINATISRLKTFADSRDDFKTELVFVDDGSKDATRQLLKQASRDDSRVKLLGFARNFGHQIAVSAGLDVCSGDVVVIIDADLQDPPEVIHEMIAKWKEGFDVVYGTRTERPGESSFKLGTARIFYRLLNKLSDTPIPLDTGDFRLLTRRVVDVLISMPEKDRFVRGMVSWVGFRQTPLLYKRQVRAAGVTKYPLKKMLKFATDGILSFSTRPLQASVALGLVTATMSICGIIYALVLRIFTNIWVEGWTAMMISILFMGGVQLICLGILGEYVGRIYAQVKSRPLYIVQEAVGLLKKS